MNFHVRVNHEHITVEDLLLKVKMYVGSLMYEKHMDEEYSCASQIRYDLKQLEADMKTKVKAREPTRIHLQQGGNFISSEQYAGIILPDPEAEEDTEGGYTMGNVNLVHKPKRERAYIVTADKLFIDGKEFKGDLSVFTSNPLHQSLGWAAKGTDHSYAEKLADISDAIRRRERGGTVKFDRKGYAQLADQPEHTGGSVNYYKVSVEEPVNPDLIPYTAECLDIALKLGMTIEEFNVFKAIWRTAAERTLGMAKEGNNAKYDAEKMVFFSEVNLRRYT